MRPEGSQRELLLVTRRLIAEFGDRVDIGTIVRVAREEVLLFDRAKKRDRVSAIAWLLARDRLLDSLSQRPSDAPHPGGSPGVRGASKVGI